MFEISPQTLFRYGQILKDERIDDYLNSSFTRIVTIRYTTPGECAVYRVTMENGKYLNIEKIREWRAE